MEKICSKYSCFKRDFLGAPIWRALKALQEGKTSPSLNCEIPYRKDEKYWIVAGKNDVTVAFSLNFDNKTDKALARIFLLVRMES